MLIIKHFRINAIRTVSEYELNVNIALSILSEDHEQLLGYIDLDCLHEGNVIVAGAKHYHILPLLQIVCWSKCI